MQLKRGISQATFRRLMGELVPRDGIICTVHGCDGLAICLIGCGKGHASCERHAQGADYISPLGDE